MRSVTLYHWEPNANSGKPMLALMEKGVAFNSHYLDLLNFDQHQPDYLAINPQGTIPAMLHGERVLTESTAIMEYVDEEFPGPRLMPEDPAHAPAVARIFRHEARTGELLVDVFHDRGRLGEHALPMQHRRDRPLRIDGEVIGLMLIEIEEVEVVAVERHPFFHQREHGLAGIGVGFPVIQGDAAHRPDPSFCKCCIPLARPPVKPPWPVSQVSVRHSSPPPSGMQQWIGKGTPAQPTAGAARTDRPKTCASAW